MKKYYPHKAKRLIVPALLFFMLFSTLILSSCRTSTPDKNDETSSVQPRKQEPTVFQNRGLLYCNQFDSVGEPPFSLPEGSPDIDSGYYYYTYNHFSAADYESYVSSLEKSGFELVEMKYSSFLFRDDCMIFIHYSSEEELSLSWYSESPYAKDGGEDASLPWYDGEDSLSKINIHPIDVTPEGFYELTGGQMFAIPYYSYDTFKAPGQESLMFEDNEWYGCSVCYVKDNTVFKTSMESVAVCDFDGDQTNDVLLLSFGPTSGLFTFDVMVITKDGIYDSIFNTAPYSLGFADKDGKIVIKSVGYGDEQNYFDIVLEKNGDETVVMLYDAGEPLELWGIPNTRNYTVLPESYR